VSVPLLALGCVSFLFAAFVAATRLDDRYPRQDHTDDIAPPPHVRVLRGTRANLHIVPNPEQRKEPDGETSDPDT